MRPERPPTQAPSRLRLAALAAIFAGRAVAGDGSAERLKEVERQIRQTDEETKAIQAQAQGLLDEIERLDRSIGDRERRVRELGAEVREAQARKDAAERTLAELDAADARLRAEFVARARGLYRLERRGLAPLVLQMPTDWNDAVRYQRSLAAILAHDHELVAELGRSRAATEAARSAARSEAATLAARRTESARELESLRAERSAKREMVASLRGEGEKHRRLLEALKSSAEKLHELIDQEEASKAAPFEPPAAQPARMLSPLRTVDGEVAASRNGVEIRAAAGTPIVAVKAGRVVFAGWFAGYGRMVIIDHGEHLYSVYGYAGDVLVETGHVVAAGDTIATVGATGPVAAPSLYFEIRERGVARDPAGYIPTLARK